MKTLQAMVAGIVAARGSKAESTDEGNKTKSLEERLDAFSKPLPEGKRYASMKKDSSISYISMLKTILRKFNPLLNIEIFSKSSSCSSVLTKI